MKRMFIIAQTGRSRVLTAIVAGMVVAANCGVGSNGRWRP